MKKLGIILLVSVLFPAWGKADWKGIFELSNGIRIIRKSTGIWIHTQEFTLCEKEIAFEKKVKTQEAEKAELIIFSLELSPEDFKKEVQKFGQIKFEKITINTKPLSKW